MIFVLFFLSFRYFEVEAREAPVSEDCLVLTAERAKPLIDENTIGEIARSFQSTLLTTTTTTELDVVMALNSVCVQLLCCIPCH